MLDIAITGLGTVAATGLDLNDLASALRAGLPVGSPAPASLRTHLEEPELLAFDRASQLAVVAARLAHADAGSPRHPADALGVSFGNTYGCLAAQVELDRVVLTEGPRAMRGSLFPYGVFNAPAGNVAIALHARGPNLTYATGEAAGADACMHAARQIACGDADAVLAGGVETITSDLASWRDTLPGAQGTPGEGAAVLMLESQTVAELRGARVYGRILGAASRLADDASPERHAHAALTSARAALAEAEVAPGDIRLVVRQGAWLADLFGDTLPETLDPHAVLGNLRSASGAFQLVMALLTHGAGPLAGPMLSLSLSAEGIATCLVFTS